MNFKKIGLFMTSLGLVFMAGNSLNAEINYSENESYYQKLCAKRSGYKANKQVCQGYESYLKKQKSTIESNTKDIEEQIESTKGDISKLLGIINENQKLIDEKVALIQKTKEEIIIKEKEIANLEKEIMDRMATMQEINGENFVIDFIMSSVSLDDLVVKMDGIKAINLSTSEMVSDLEYAKKDLAEDKKALEKEEAELKKAKASQEAMLKEYRSKEAELFIKLEEERKRKAIYNKKLDTININDIVNSKGFGRPVAHATVTAAAWYYPESFGGGWHPGIDLANGYNTPILAPANGVVLMTGYEDGGYGNFMVTAHKMGNDTYTFIYGHLNRYLDLSSIKQGQTIAYMGSSGNSTGPHTHFEVFKHKNKSLNSVINEYRNNYDIYFGLGYSGVGSCSNVCRIKPHEFLNVKYGQTF